MSRVTESALPFVRKSRLLEDLIVLPRPASAVSISRIDGVFELGLVKNTLSEINVEIPVTTKESVLTFSVLTPLPPPRPTP